MGLLTKEIEVALHGMNIKRYESLGYKIPRTKDEYGKMRVPLNTKISVKIKDVSFGSNAKIKLQCDECGKEYETIYRTYSRYSRNGETYCNTCASKKFNSGERNWNWNCEKTKEEREQSRNYAEYHEFIRKVLARDNYTCVCCKRKKQMIEVHHLDGYNWCIDKRIDVENAVSLCNLCHKNFHIAYGRGNNTKQQFIEWLNNELPKLKYDEEITPNKKVYCLETNTTYSSVKEVARVLKLKSCDMVYRACGKNKNCKTAFGYHFLWDDEYRNMTEEELSDFLKQKKKRRTKVVCLTTGEVFEELKKAGEQYCVFPNSICVCCKGKMKSAGTLEDGTKLQWMYYDDFLKLSIENQDEILRRKDGK